MNAVAKAALLIITASFAGILIVTAIPSNNIMQAIVGAGIGIIGFWVAGRGKRERHEQLRIGFDIITITIFGIFFLTILFSNLGGIISTNQPTINLAQFMISFWLGGVIMWFISNVFTFKAEIRGKALNKVMLYIAMSFSVFFLANLIVPPTVPVLFKQSILANATLAQNGPFVTVMMSVPEETVFRAWLAPWLGNISRTGVAGGTIGSAFLFMVYHLFVYGTSPALLIIIFLDGLAQGFAALQTRVLGTTIFTHVVNNAISVNFGIAH